MNTLLEDAIIIYKEILPARDVPIEAELDMLTDMFCKWWLKEIDNSHFFNDATKMCPTLAAKINLIYKEELDVE